MVRPQHKKEKKTTIIQNKVCISETTAGIVSHDTRGCTDVDIKRK